MVSTIERSPSLVRAIGRWSLAALMVNTMIGASIFGIPSLIAGHLGRLSPAGYLVAAAGVAIIVGCFAEVASQFREAGGPYLYAREAFGQFVGIQIGWLTWLSRISAVSAVANLFISYLAEFLPAVNNSLSRAGVLTLLIASLATINYRGVSGGNRLSNFFTATKLALIALFIGGGLAALAFDPGIRATPPAVAATAADWFEAVILMVYAFAGFEAALFVSGEARNPRRDVPIALLAALITTSLLYIAMQYVVIYTLPDAAASTKPAVDAARRFMGPLGVSLVGAGALVCIYGYLSANMLHTPRLTYAMGERRDFPRFFAAIHPRFRTPHLSIVTFAFFVILFSVGGSFRWNATVTAVSRLFIYGSIAGALLVMRKKRPRADAFRLPAGMLFGVLGLLFTGVLITRMHIPEFVVLASTFAIAFFNWLAVRRQ
jgi:basic amino acid/polyamine antiporter, APA family